MSLYSPNDSDDFNFTDDQFNLFMSDCKESSDTQIITADLFDIPEDVTSPTWNLTDNQQTKPPVVLSPTNTAYTLRPKVSPRKPLVDTNVNSDNDNAIQTSAKPKSNRNPMSQNAILAKANREKKKEFVASLQDRISQLEYNNSNLVATTKRLRSSRRSLRHEVLYLKRVLHNDSSLANVLRRIDNVKEVSLSNRFSNERTALKDHDYTANNTTGCSASHSNSTATSLPFNPSSQPTPGAGVCIYVDGSRVSLELCASCSLNASQPRRSLHANNLDDSSEDEDVVVDDEESISNPRINSSQVEPTRKRKLH